MTRVELDAALARLGLDVPERERQELVGAVGYVAEMARLVKKPRWVGAEPAHTVAFPIGAFPSGAFPEK
ncbi:MAG TPA: hypothetical protein VFC56_03780 [Stellaceae bacterium]|nr:hypothetical protein [Stellaceae bacterium]